MIFINKKYKRSSSSFLKEIANIKANSVIVTSEPNISDDMLKKVGFSLPIENGDNVVPCELGRFTDYNLNGKHVVHKDRPKEKRYVNTIYWTWTLWNGEEQGRFCDIYRKCYPVTEELPPLEIMIYSKNKKCVISEPIKKTDAKRLLHVVNMFLEVFGSCVVTDSVDNVQIVKRLPWIIFPQGHKFEGKNLSIIDVCPNFYKKNKREQQFIATRHDYLMSQHPSAVYVGASYFRNYTVYTYQEEHLSILESTSLDNATYVFDENWETYSKMTKKEVVTGNYHKERIIHQKNWFYHVGKLFKTAGKIFS